MRRIGVAFITICILLFSSVATAATAGIYREITYEQARLLMLEHNTTLREQRNALNKARRQYLAYLRTEDDEEENYYRDESSILNMLKQKELVPLQMRYNRETLEENLKIIRYPAEFSFRNAYANLYSRFKTLEAWKEALITAEKAYLGKEKEYGMGLIGDL